MTTRTQVEAKSTSTPIPAMQPAHSGLLPQQEQEEPDRSSLSSEDRLRSPNSPTPPPINPSVGHGFGTMAIGPTTPPVLQRMAIANKNLIQRQENTAEEEKEEEEPIQMKAISPLSVPLLQRQMNTEEEERNDEEEAVQTKAISPLSVPLLQRQVNPEEEEEKTIQAKALPGQGLTHFSQRYGQMVTQAKVKSVPGVPVLQRKLAIGQPNDQYEQEADRVATQVMRMESPTVPQDPETEEESIQPKSLAETVSPLIQRELEPEEEDATPIQSLSIQREEILEEEEAPILTKPEVKQREEDSEEAEPIQTKPAKLAQRESLEDEEPVQLLPIQQENPLEEEPVQTQREEDLDEEIQTKRSRISNLPFSPANDLESQLRQTKSGGSPLSDDVRAFMESRFGTDFSQVRVHTDSPAIQMNKELRAQAFTHGKDIYYGSGKTPGKNDLTAHELTHVIQQTGSTKLNREIRRTIVKPKSLQTKQLSEPLSDASPLHRNIQRQFLEDEPSESIQAKQFSSLERISNKAVHSEVTGEEEGLPSFTPVIPSNTNEQLPPEAKESDSIQAKELPDLTLQVIANKEVQRQPESEELETIQSKELPHFTIQKIGDEKSYLGTEEEQDAIQAKELSESAPTLISNKDVQSEMEEEEEPIQAKELPELSADPNRKVQLKPVESLVNQISFNGSTASGVATSSPLLQRNILSDIKGLAERGWNWIISRVIDPLKQLASQGWNAIKQVGSQIATAYRQANPNIRDIFQPEHLVFRTLRNLRRSSFAKKMQEERQRRAQDPARNPDPNARVDEPSQLEKLNDLMETFEPGADQYFEVKKEIVEGAVLGDFKENPTIWNTIGQIAIGFVPYAGQAADIRDTIAAITKLHKSGWKDGGAWFDLVLTLIGWIPGLGDVIKAIGRVAKRFLGKALTGVLKNADKLLRPVLKRAKGMLSAAKKYGKRFIDWAKQLGPKLLQGVKNLAKRATDFAKSIGQRARQMVSALKNRVGQFIRGAVDRAKGLMDRAKGFLGQAVGKFLSKTKQVFGDVQRRLSGAVDSVKRLAQRGKEIALQVGRRIANVTRKARELMREFVQSAIKRGRAALESAKRWGIQQFQRAKSLGSRLVKGARQRVTVLIRKGVDWVKEKAIKWIKEKIKNIKNRILNFLRKLWYKITRTKPSGRPDPHAAPGGRKTTISPNDDAATIRSLRRENESADLLARNGYKVEQNPIVPGLKNPDYKIEGRIFDNYAPSTSNSRNIWSNLKTEKIDTGQAERIVLNLEDSAVDLNKLKKQFNDWPMPGLKEVIVVKNGQIIPFWP
jgi:hypothetical protein